MFAFMKKMKPWRPAESPLHGSAAAMPVPEKHFVNGHPLQGPFPAGLEQAVFAMGCFWGAERIFWQTPGVYSTSVGYAGGQTRNPAYEEVCTRMNNHTKAVRGTLDPKLPPY